MYLWHYTHAFSLTRMHSALHACMQPYTHVCSLTRMHSASHACIQPYTHVCSLLTWSIIILFITIIGIIYSHIVIWDGALWFWSVIKTIMTDYSHRIHSSTNCNFRAHDIMAKVHPLFITFLVTQRNIFHDTMVLTGFIRQQTAIF